MKRLPRSCYLGNGNNMRVSAALHVQAINRRLDQPFAAARAAVD